MYQVVPIWSGFNQFEKLVGCNKHFDAIDCRALDDANGINAWSGAGKYNLHAV